MEKQVMTERRYVERATDDEDTEGNARSLPR
jgi:hypothetical protein